jgi:hypothetical protein
MNKIDFIANIRHIGWVAYQIAAGQPYNEQINQDQYESLVDGIKFALENPNITPEENHNNWMEMKIKQGWIYGNVKDFEKKTHPDLVSFDELPDIEKRKDIADSTSHKMALELWNILSITVLTVDDPNKNV